MNIARREKFVAVAATLAAIAVASLIARWVGRGPLVLLALVCVIWLALHLLEKREMRRLARAMNDLTPEAQEDVLAHDPALADEVLREMERARKDDAGDA
jgi:hypothetical protein